MSIPPEPGLVAMARMINTCLWPARGVHFARVFEDVVVLDVSGDTYACLLDAAAWLDLEPTGRLLIRDEEAAKDLLTANLATAQPPAFPPRSPRIPCGELSPSSEPSLSDAVDAWIKLVGGTVAFQGKALSDLVTTASAEITSEARSKTHVARRLSAYRAALPLVPGEGECLQRAFLLKRFLARHRIEADWVFGVRTWPFGAHCWIQIGEDVVGDTLARVMNYTPIMVV